MPRKTNKPAKPDTESTAKITQPEVASRAIPEDCVEALVLCDSVHGKCGEVKAFSADAIKSLTAAGFIDAHPNAVSAYKKA